jgi:hypothetical protein
MERGLDRRDAGVHHGADLIERIAEHVHEDDAAALRHRQAHEGAQARGRDLPVVRGDDGIDHHVRVLVGVGGLAPGAPPQKVQRRVVRDAEQPALRMGDRFRLRQGLDRLHQRFLNDILAIHHRAGHAGAVAMQLGPQLAEQPVDGRARLGCAAGRGHALTAVLLGGEAAVARILSHDPLSIR